MGTIVDWARGKVELNWSRRSGKFFGKSSDRPTCTVAVVFSAECRKKHKKRPVGEGFG